MRKENGWWGAGGFFLVGTSMISSESQDNPANYVRSLEIITSSLQVSSIRL